MDDKEMLERLSRIETRWSLVARSQGGPQEAEAVAQAALLERYQQAIYRHLIRGTGNANLADELFQEFALRFMRGDFRRANEERGRFRDYVRAALNNLIRANRAPQAGQVSLQHAEQVPATEEPIDLDGEFLTNWRRALFDRAWEGLASLEVPGGQPFHTALRLRFDQPDLTAGQMAELLTARLQPREPYTEAATRKLVQRARDLFTDLLLDEIERSLGNPSLEELEQEVIDLGLQPYCKRGLERRRKE
jgi:RNA polymerase sigma-70 factor (ECF subfamily)